MVDISCFVSGCMLDAEYACPCSSPQTYCCKLHVINHLEVLNKTHTINSIFIKPCEETREAMLKFLVKTDSKHQKLKKKLLASYSQQFFGAKSDLEALMKEIDTYLSKLSNCITKLSGAKKISKSEQDPVLGLLSLQPDEAIQKVKTIIPINPDLFHNGHVFCGFNEKIEKMIEYFIENKFQNYLDSRLTKIENTLEEHNTSINLANNELANIKNSISTIINENNASWKYFEEWKQTIKLKTENEVNSLNSRITSITENLKNKFKEAEITQNVEKIIDIGKRFEIPKGSGNQILEESKTIGSAYSNDMQAYQDSANNSYQQAFLFNLKAEGSRTNLLTFNLENEAREVNILETSQLLNWGTCIAQLPNDKIFCFGSEPASGITLIIDENKKIQELAPGTPCSYSSAIYFNNSAYCFGGKLNGKKFIKLSSKFDLDRNQWIQLNPLPQFDAYCNSIIFNGSILISGFINKNLLRFSIDSNVFTSIPYNFALNQVKILINGERLYLIECGKNGFIFESEIGSDINWRRIANSEINFKPLQVNFQYNKGRIYIGCVNNNKLSYFKFDMSEKKISLIWVDGQDMDRKVYGGLFGDIKLPKPNPKSLF